MVSRQCAVGEIHGRNMATLVPDLQVTDRKTGKLIYGDDVNAKASVVLQESYG